MARNAKDYAIEFGGYLAEAARNFQAAMNSGDPGWRDEAWAALSSAIYEFEKRAAKARANV
jgi:hypothetical protein